MTSVTELLARWNRGDRDALAELMPLARVVELRYFGGLSIEDTAEVLDVSPGTPPSAQIAELLSLASTGCRGRRTFATGPAVDEIRTRITELRTALGCL